MRNPPRCRGLKLFVAALLSLLAPPVLYGDAAPATRPAAARPAAGVLVMRFAALHSPPDSRWIAASLQQSVATDMTLHGIQPASTDAAAPTTAREAMAAGQKAGSQYVIYGVYEVVADRIRVEARVLNTSDGKVVGAAKSTGSTADLFAVEDGVGVQFAQALGGSRAAVATAIEPTGAVRLGYDRYVQSQRTSPMDNAYNRYYFNAPVYPWFNGYGLPYGNYGYVNGGLYIPTIRWFYSGTRIYIPAPAGEWHRGGHRSNH